MQIKEILNTEDLELLIEEKINISNQIKEQLALIQEVINWSDLPNRTKLVNYQGKIQELRIIQNAINNREYYLNSSDYRDDNNRINYNFRVLAKKILDKDKFQEIYQLANKSLKESKQELKNQIKLDI